MEMYGENSGKTYLYNIQRIFSEAKNLKFHWKNFESFYIFAQNIDCGYKLEPPN